MAQKNKYPSIVEPKHTKRNIIIVVVIFIILAIPIDIYFTGLARFAVKVVECGRMPVVVYGGPYINTYHTPGNYIPGGAGNGLFCTNAQAEAAGFTHSSFDGVK